MNKNPTVEVLIPHHSASVSKMSKKNWKCWAKLLIAAPSLINGQATEKSYRTTPLSAGSRTNLLIGSVVIHYDESDCAGVGVVDAQGEIDWLETCPCEGWIAGLWSAATSAFATNVADGDKSDRDTAIAEIRRLMVAHSITITELS